MEKVGRMLGCTTGQAWTLLIGIVLAAVLMMATFPPALRTNPTPLRPAITDRVGSESRAGSGFVHP